MPAGSLPDKLNPPLRAPDAVAALRVELRCFSDVSFDKLQMLIPAVLPEW